MSVGEARSLQSFSNLSHDFSGSGDLFIHFLKVIRCQMDVIGSDPP
jgi:hypothetical protein